MTPEAEALRKALWGHDPQEVCRIAVTELGIDAEIVGLITEREITVPGKGERRWVGSNVAASALSTLLEVADG